MDEKRQIIKNILAEQTNFIFQDNGKPVYPSDAIWLQTSKVLLKNLIFQSILKLYNQVLKSIPTKKRELVDVSDTGQSTSESDTENEKLNFVITLSDNEWETIKPINVFYKHGKSKIKEYSILPPHRWSSIIFSHFWNHTKVCCSLIFKNAKVFSYGKNFIEIKGYCSECGSTFFSSLNIQPDGQQKAMFKTTYTGPFRKVAHSKKRPLAGQNRRQITNMLLDQNISCSVFRKTQAAEIMQFGDPEPPHLAKASVLRNAVAEEKQRRRLSDSVTDAVYLAKYTPPYNAYIKDLGLDKFFIHYWSPTQVHVYNEYCKENVL